MLYMYHDLSFAQGDYHIAFKARELGHFTGFCRFQGYWVLFFGESVLITVLALTLAHEVMKA